MLKLLHTADWQIGKLFGQFAPDEAALLAEARFKTVERLAALATQHHVDLVLVAGDVFETQTVAGRTIHRLANAMAGFAGPWVLIPGNHDASLAESVWTHAARLKAFPANVHICLQPQPLLLESIGAVVLPAPLTQRHTYADLTEWFATADTPPAMARIGLAHGCVQGILAEEIDSPNPIAAGRAEQARLDYLALGDWHGARQIDARTWYSGTPETDRFKRNDSGQALLVELAGPGQAPSVQALASGHYRWHSYSLTLQVPSDLDQALQQIAGFGATDVVQVSVSGRIDLAGHRALHDALEQARGKARGVLADLSALQLDPTPQDIDALKADGYLGDVIDDLRAAQEGPDAQTARDALSLLAGVLNDRRAGAETDSAR